MLRIATFNMENLDDRSDDKNPALTAPAPILRSALERRDADILCRQEVHGQELPGHTAHNPKRNLSALDTVLEDTPYTNVERVCTLTAANEPYDVRNLVILSRYHLHHGHGNLLDRMLISQSLLPYFQQAEIHNENLHDESLPFTYDTKYPESDHAPFVSEFR
jgi:exonuclease III